jgi:L-aspartate oxidase
LTECFVFGARAARAAAAETAPDRQEVETLEPEGDAAPDEQPAPSQQSREALWRLAGLERTGEGLRALIDDPHPLVRLIAVCALVRTESRGAHRRLDYPATDPGFDARHASVVADAEPTIDRWD